MIDAISEESFKRLVLKGEGLHLVDFYASWCGPCTMMTPLLQRLKSQVPQGVKFWRVDFDTSGELTQELNIQTVPTLLLYKDGELLEILAGFPEEQRLLEKINTYLQQ